MSKQKKKGGSVFPPDKYKVKYSNNPDPGKYDVEKAEALIRPKSPAVQIMQPLKLYSKAAANPSVRPEPITKHLKPFAAEVKGGRNAMGSKYVAKVTKYPTPRGRDAAAAKDAILPKVTGKPFGYQPTSERSNSMQGSINQSFRSPSVRSSSFNNMNRSFKSQGRQPLSGSFIKTPDIGQIKQMSRKEKIALINKLQESHAASERGDSMNGSMMAATPIRPRGSIYGTPARQRPQTSVKKPLQSMPSSMFSPGLSKKSVNEYEASSTKTKSPPDKNLASLVRAQDQMTSSELIDFLNKIIEAETRIGEPQDDIGVIFDKIQLWKESFGDLDKQEKAVSKSLKSKGLKIHNAKSLMNKLAELQPDIGLTDDEILIMIFTSLDDDWFTNLLVLAGQFTMWFNLNFEGESREELDFKENKEELWGKTCNQAKQVVEKYKSMTGDKEEILQQKWWEQLRFSRFGNELKQKFDEKPRLMEELRTLFRNQKDKLSYYDLFQFIQHQVGMSLKNWEEDAIEGRLDRLGMAFIEFNEFNEFSQEYGINWNEALLESDLEDILDAKLNLSYKDYKLKSDDYFMGIKTVLNSEKAALAKVNQIYSAHQKEGKKTKYLDTDFGPKGKGDENGNKYSLYKNGKPLKKGYPDPADVEWENIEKLKLPKGKKPQFVDDGVASDDCMQGKLGDCWFISAMSVLATRDELLIGGRRGMEYDEDMIVDKEIASLLDNGVYPPIFHRYRSIGLYVLRFFKNFQWIYVIVDQRIPVDKKTRVPIFGRCRNLHELWVPLIEKAYAKIHGCYENLISGYVDEGIQELTGMQPEKIFIRDDKTGVFPHKMISLNYGGADEFWDFLLKRDQDGCLLGCSIKGMGKEGQQIIDGAPSGLILNHAYGINDVFELQDPYDEDNVFRLMRLRNPWGNSEWLGAWSELSQEMKTFGKTIKETYIDKLPPDEQFDLRADDGTFLMHYDDWKDNFSTLFLNLDFPEDWTGVRFKSKWTKSNSGGLPSEYKKEHLERYAKNPQFYIKPAQDTEVMISLTQTGGRLPVQNEQKRGLYSEYPFSEQLHYAAVTIFELKAGATTLDSFDKNKLVFQSPIKRERENSGRCVLKAGEDKAYIIVCSTELQGKKGDFYLSVYFNQALRDVQLKRVFNAEDKQAGKEQVLPYFIPEEAEKLVNQTPLWKIKLVQESLKYMMTDEDAGPPKDDIDVVDVDVEIEGPVFQTEISIPLKRQKTDYAEAKGLPALVSQNYRMSADQVNTYLNELVTSAKTIGDPKDEVENIFKKIKIWKQKFGDLEKQETGVSQALKQKGVRVHNVRTLTEKLDSLAGAIGLTSDDIKIIICTSLDHDYFSNLLVRSGEFTMWFNLNFGEESAEKDDFKQNKLDIWEATVFHSQQIVDQYKSLTDKFEILTQKWWEKLRFSKFGQGMKDAFGKNPQLKSELRNLFKSQHDKISYWNLFQFIEHKLKIKLRNWEEDALEGRLDRLGMAFIEFNEFNEFSIEQGLDWGEKLLSLDLEDILDRKLNLSYKDYEVTKLDYFMDCPTMLKSEKAALAMAEQLFSGQKKNALWVDQDFGPKNRDDFVGGKMAMYKTGKPFAPGYPDPQNTVWLHVQDTIKGGKMVEFVDDGVASDDCIQGTLGDCWFITALSVLATRDELLVGGRKGMDYDVDMIIDKDIASILDNGVYPPIFHKYRSKGIYVFRFFKNFEWVYVLVDQRIPMKAKTLKPVFGRCRGEHELWVPLIEKAYAKLHGCYENLMSGYLDEGVQELTGMQPEKILIRDEKAGTFPHKMIAQNYGGADGFWDFLVKRDQEGCLLGCSIIGHGKRGPQVNEGKPSGLILGHSYGINDVFVLQDPENKDNKFKLLRLRNPWGNSEWLGAWSGDSPEMKKYGPAIQKDYIDNLAPDEQFALDADDGTFLMIYEEWRDNFSTLFLNLDFPEDWTGVRFKSKWTKSNSAGLPTAYTPEKLQNYARNPQFFIRPAYDTEIMFSMTQTGGRLPLYPGEYSVYPFAEQLYYGCVAVFECKENMQHIESFDKDRLKFMSPIKRERENSGRCKLQKEKSYVIVCSTELEDKRGEFFLSVYFNQNLRDVQCKRVFHPLDKQADFEKQILPYFIPEEAEKLSNQTPLWKIHLVKDSLKFMMTDDDE